MFSFTVDNLFEDFFPLNYLTFKNLTCPEDSSLRWGGSKQLISGEWPRSLSCHVTTQLARSLQPLSVSNIIYNCSQVTDSMYYSTVVSPETDIFCHPLNHCKLYWQYIDMPSDMWQYKRFKIWNLELVEICGPCGDTNTNFAKAQLRSGSGQESKGTRLKKDALRRKGLSLTINSFYNCPFLGG